MKGSASMGQPAGPEAEGGLLADFAVAIGDRVLRVAVDADHAVDLHCNARLLQNLPRRSGWSRTIRSKRGAKLNRPARWEPTCPWVRRAISGSIRTGVPAAEARSSSWHERSIVMNHQTASSTE